MKKPVIVMLFSLMVLLSGCTNGNNTVEIFDSLPKLTIATETEKEIEKVNNNTEMIELKTGGYTYKITAEWTNRSEDMGNSQLSYCFHATSE